VDIYYNFSRLLLTLKSYLYYHYYLLLLLLLQLVEEVSCGPSLIDPIGGTVVEIAKYSKIIRRQNLPLKGCYKAAVGSVIRTGFGICSSRPDPSLLGVVPKNLTNFAVDLV